MSETPKAIILPSLENIKEGHVKEVLQQILDMIEENHQHYQKDLEERVNLITDGDTTPDVRGAKVLKTANTGATSITTFDNGGAAQRITIIFGDADTTILETGNIILRNAFTSAINDVMVLIYDGTNWREVSRSTAGYVDRGDPVAQDFDDADLTTDGAWHDLDLSSIVPNGAIAVALRLSVKDGAVDSRVRFRKNGNSNTANVAQIRTQVIDLFINADLKVGCDSNRVIEYWASSLAFTNIDITVKGWWI